MAQAKTTEMSETEKARIATLKSKAYSKAESALRNAHLSEFQDLLAAEYKELGLTYERKLTPEEKALAEINAILEKYPTLRDTIVDSADVPVEPSGDWNDATPADLQG